MSNLQISQLNVLLQACTLLVVSCFLLKIIDGQDWPTIIDPFPDDIGPEPPQTPPPTPDCTYACQARIDETMGLISALQQRLADTNTSLLNRITYLEANSGGGGGGTDYALTNRVSTLEINLPSNVTMLMNKINDDINALRNQLRGEIEQLRRDMENRINNLPTGGGGGDGGAKAMEVYLNLTTRINNLENGKIQNLMNDNTLWRQNFKVVNNTFSKLKKSAFSNNVVLNG